MPGKGKGKKGKEQKEEKKVEEKEPVLPDGKKTYVVGGWSSLQSVNAALAKVEPGDQVLINALQGGAKYEERVLLQKDTVLLGSGSSGAEATVTAPRAAVDAARKDAGDAAGLATALGVELNGLVVKGVGAEGEAAKPPAAAPGVPSATVQKKWVLAEVNGMGWPGPADAAAFAAGDSDECKAWLKAAIEADKKQTQATFRESMDGDTRPVIGGGLESTAERAVLRGVIVHGGLRVRKGALRIHACDFAGATDEQPNLLSIDSYAAPEVRRCRFRGAAKACVYCYPHSAGSVEECDIAGAEKGGAGCGVFTDNGATSFGKNSIRGHSTGVYASCAADEDRKHPYGIQQPLFQGNAISDISGTGIHLDNGADAQFKRNTISGCGYWGVTVSRGAKGLLKANTVDSMVRISEGARPHMLANLISARVVDENDRGTRALDERY